MPLPYPPLEPPPPHTTSITLHHMDGNQHFMDTTILSTCIRCGDGCIGPTTSLVEPFPIHDNPFYHTLILAHKQHLLMGPEMTYRTREGSTVAHSSPLPRVSLYQCVFRFVLLVPLHPMVPTSSHTLRPGGRTMQARAALPGAAV